jgi:branched-chain amino acid transport system permease protein
MEISGLLAYLVALAITAGIYAVFCLGLNIQWGYTGLFNIGIAGFFCIGAYTSAMITLPAPTGIYAKYVHQLFGFNLPFIFGLLGAALVCGILAFLIGIPTLRLGEDYLAISTLGIAETIRLIFNNEKWLANGARGLHHLPVDRTRHPLAMGQGLKSHKGG